MEEIYVAEVNQNGTVTKEGRRADTREEAYQQLTTDYPNSMIEIQGTLE